MKLAGAYINDDKYERLVALAESNNRTLAGQCRHLFDRALSGELQVPECRPVGRREPAAVAAGAAAAATSAGAGAGVAGAKAQARPPVAGASARPAAGGARARVVKGTRKLREGAAL